MVPTTPRSARLSRPQLLGLFVTLATLVAFRNSLNGTFVFDDVSAIQDNPTIRHLWPPWAALQPPRETSVAGRPLINLLLAVNYAIHALEPRGYHIVNLAIHVAAALTLFNLLRALLRAPALGGRFKLDADLLAAIVAGLWAIHPLQTESVTYVVQRAESMCGLVYLLSLYCFVRSVSWHRSSVWRIACIASCFVGMACKEVMVTAPVCMLLIDRALYASSFKQALRSRVGLYLGVASSWLALATLLSGAPRPMSAGSALPFGPLEYLRTEAGVILHYIRLSFWPHPLILDYGWPMSPSWLQALPTFLAVAGLLGVTILIWTRRPAAALPAALFFLLLAPTSSFYPILDPAYEHRMYLPLAPVILIATLVVRAIIHRIARETRPRMIALIAFAFLVAIPLTLRTFQRNADYADPVVLWRSTLKHGGLNNPRAINNLSAAFLLAGQYAEARQAALHAVQLASDNPEAYSNLCVAATSLGMAEESINMGRIAVALRKDWPQAHYNLGVAYYAAGREDEARTEFQAVLALSPENITAARALAALDHTAAPNPNSRPSVTPAIHIP